MGAPTSDTIEGVGELLHEAGETHHAVYRIVDGADDDWLTTLSELPELLGVRPVHSELTYLLVALDKQYVSERPAERWESYYARRVIEHFAPAASAG